MDWSVNIWSVLLAAFAASVLGFLWYGPFFGKTWMKLTGIKMPTGKAMEKAQKEMWKSIVGQYIAYVAGAYVMGLIIYTGTREWSYGAVWGAIVGLGVIGVALLNSVMWEGKPFKLYVLNASYYIIAYAIMGAIIGCSKWA